MLSSKFQTNKIQTADSDKFFTLKPVLTAIKFSGDNQSQKQIKKWVKQHYQKLSIMPEFNQSSLVQDQETTLLLVGKIYPNPKFESLIQYDVDVELVYSFYQFQNKDEKQLTLLKKYKDEF